MLTTIQSPEAAVVQLFEEVKRHKPSVIYVPDVNIWYETLPDAAKKTFVGLLRSLPPTDPVLLLGTMELQPDDNKPDPRMLRDLFGYSTQNQFELARPNKTARHDFFDHVISMIRKHPSEFPDAGARKKRKLAELPVAPAPNEPEGPSKEDLKALKKKDRQTLNVLKIQIQSVMDQIKLKYKKFRTAVIDDATIAYLYNEQDPTLLTTDLTEEQRQQQQLFRPYEIDHDDKGVPGLREVASGKFYYNLEIVTIEKRLSNGYYKRPKDFLGDIKRLAKDAKTFGDQERTLKANEMLANVEVDMTTLETTMPVFAAECEAVYQREQQRERERIEKLREAERRGEEVPKIVPNVPPVNASKTTADTSGPVMLGQEVPGRQLFPTTAQPGGGPSPQSIPWSTTQTNGSYPSHQTNGSSVPSRPREEDSDMHNSQWETQGHDSNPDQSQSQPQHAQKSGHDVLASGSQADQYQNSASTTGSSHKASDRSSGASGNTQASNGVPRHQPDFSNYGPRGGSQEPATQEPSMESQPNSQPSQSSQQMAPPRPSHRASSISALLNNPEEQEGDDHRGNLLSRSNQVILDEDKLQAFHDRLVHKSSGLSLEQLEQVHAALMEVVWTQRGNLNRNQVWGNCQDAFNATIRDIEECQKILGPSQED